jgi:H+/Cl- antiporter ClcA
MYSVAFITPALGAFLLVRQGSALEYFTLGLTQVIGGIFTIAGVLIVDANLQRVDWTQSGTWAWMLLFALLGVVGVLLVLLSRRMRPAEG